MVNDELGRTKRTLYGPEEGRDCSMAQQGGQSASDSSFSYHKGVEISLFALSLKDVHPVETEGLDLRGDRSRAQPSAERP